VLLLLVFALSPVNVSAQEKGKANEQSAGPTPAKDLKELRFKQQSFTFVRIQYSSARAGVYPAWMIDFPDSDLNFTARFQKVTGLKCDPDGKVMALTNAALSQFPFIYMVEGGQLRLNDAEVVALHQYLSGGGFLMVDDFWGESEWKAFSAQMKRVFPDRESVELPMEHPIFHCFYELHEKPQVPNVMLGIQSQHTGITWEREDAKQAHYRGLFDDRGRLMAIFCHNTDLGDGWEREGEDAYYYKEFSLKKAYPMGINIVVYALSK